MAVYKYARVSTEKQDLKRQEMVMEHIQADKTYRDKVSGKGLEGRLGLNELRLVVKEGDKVYVESISRLGRNVDDVRMLCEEFRNKGVELIFLKEGITTAGETYKFVLTILAAVSEMEREQMIQNVKQGMAKARIHGTRTGNPLGRPKRTKLPKNWEKYYGKYKSGELTQVEFAKLMEVTVMTIWRWTKLYEAGDIR